MHLYLYSCYIYYHLKNCIHKKFWKYMHETLYGRYSWRVKLEYRKSFTFYFKYVKRRKSEIKSNFSFLKVYFLPFTTYNYC